MALDDEVESLTEAEEEDDVDYAERRHVAQDHAKKWGQNFCSKDIYSKKYSN